jgi:hypothetical protein
MPIGTDEDGRDDNEGPHCRNCHTGASNCYTCHSGGAYTATLGVVANQTNYAAQSFIKQSAVTDALSGACLDGGFSYPHRTLGKDMLKDELFGIDFDGTVIVAGDVRTANTGDLSAGDNSATSDFEYWIAENKNATSIIPAVQTDSGALELAAAENLDSVCIDCHGDATYWNGDDPTFQVETTTSVLPLGTYGSGTSMGWELLLKGLP